MRYAVSHRTAYQYRTPVAQSHHVVHLKPRMLPRQTLVHHSLLIDPAPVAMSDVVDYYGNLTTLLRIDETHTEFIVHARSTVDLAFAPFPDLMAGPAWEDVARLNWQPGGTMDIEVSQFIARSRHVPYSDDIAAFARASFTPGRPILDGAMHLTQRIFSEFRFDAKATDVSTPVARVLEIKRGVCQDFAHLTLAVMRSLGLPARYVSGYLMTRPPPGQIKLKGADASHAWISVWSPYAGWIDFDPTNGIIPEREHITVAFGRDYDDISPISGVLLGGGEQTMVVAVDVEPIGPVGSP